MQGLALNYKSRRALFLVNSQTVYMQNRWTGYRKATERPLKHLLRGGHCKRKQSLRSQFFEAT